MKTTLIGLVTSTILLASTLVGWSSGNTDTGKIVITNNITNIPAPLRAAVNGPFIDEHYGDVRYYSHATARPDSFLTFREAVGFKESQGKYHKINSLGYMGKYQFGLSTLLQLGIKDSARFIRSGRMQERTFIKNLKYNYKQLQPFINKYEGKKIGGVVVTKSGILAAAHLSGAGGVRRYLRSKGLRSSRDAYGSSVRMYMKRFAGYDLDEVLQ